MFNMNRFETFVISFFLFFGSIVIFSTIGNCEEVNGTTLYVGGNETEKYSYIQDAINDSSDGDTIFVYSGVHFENILINKSIELIGENKNTTIINGSGYGDVLYISADYVKIRGFNIQNSGYDAGIDIHSNYNSITNNIITNNTYAGISLQNSDNNDINDNIISYNDEIGIVLMYSSNNNTISGNIIINNSPDGIELSTGGYNVISDNTIMNNSQTGIELWSNNNIISGNIISNNPSGMKLHDANNNTFYENTIQNNIIGMGLWFTNNDNIIYHNNFINNYPAAEDTGDNIWYNTTLKEGNYWTNYNGVDINGDGIGDSPYNISEGNNQDLYPLMTPYVSKTIQEFQVDEELLYRMLIVGMIAAILFCLPVGYIWYRKYYKKK